MTLIDTSAWIEYLRDTGSRACELVDGLVVAGFVTTYPVRMELFAGARSTSHLDQLRRLLGRGDLYRWPTPTTRMPPRHIARAEPAVNQRAR